MSKSVAMRNAETGVNGTALDIYFLLCLVAVGKWDTKINRRTHIWGGSFSEA